MRLREYKYFSGGLFIYLVAVFYLHFIFKQPLADFLSVFFIVGAGFSIIAWLLLKDQPVALHRPVVKNEVPVLASLLVLVILYITWGGDYINKLIPQNWIDDQRIYSIVIFFRKLLVFVAIPWIVYRSLGFTKQDFGFTGSPVRFFSKKGTLVLIVLSVAVLLFSLFLARGGKPVREAEFSVRQLITALPLCFFWLFIEAGLIEEFFYRVILQSRLSALLRSPTGGMVVSALIFGLSHAPGLYLRGAESEGIGEQLPFLFWAAFTVAYMSLAGIFLGIIWQRTKNLWLVMALHAMLDLLPNLDDFINTWSS